MFPLPRDAEFENIASIYMIKYQMLLERILLHLEAYQTYENVDITLIIRQSISIT